MEEVDVAVKALVEQIAPMAEYLNELTAMCIPEWTRFARDLEAGYITDLNVIERELDSVLSSAYHDSVLEVFKRILRQLYRMGHYETVIFYVNFYKEMWDSDEDVMLIN